MFGKSYHRIKQRQKTSTSSLLLLRILQSKHSSHQIINIDSSLHGTICFSFGDVIVLKHFV